MKFRIVQLIAAQDGWVSMFRLPDETIHECAVAVWGIVEDEDGQRVAGFSEASDSGLTPDDDMGNFEGYRKKVAYNGEGMPERR